MSTPLQRIAHLSPERQQLLQRMLETRRETGSSTQRPAAQDSSLLLSEVTPFCMISDEDRAKLPQGVEDAYPLSMIQQGMLYHMEVQSDRATPAYHNVNSWHLQLPFDHAIFQKVLEKVVRRHAALRTSIDLESYSEPLQIVHQNVPAVIPAIDLRALPFPLQEAEILAFMEAENRTPVDLSRPPLIHFQVHRRTDDTFQFTLTEPHSISDGWSTMSTLSEIAFLYSALLNGEHLPEQPPPATSYRHFVFNERRMLKSEAAQEFWNRKLAGCTILNLPRWPQELLGKGPRDSKLYYPISRDLVSQLHSAAREAAVPFKTVLLAAHLKLLNLLTGQDDLLTGMVFHGRPETLEGEQVRGLFLNTLPLRFQMCQGTWLDLMRSALAAEIEILPYRQYPLPAVQRKWGAGKPLFEAAFGYLHFHAIGSAVEQGKIVAAETGHSDYSVTHFKLLVSFESSMVSLERLRLFPEFDTREIAAAQVHAMCGYLLRILTAIAGNPKLSHDSHCFLSNAERHQVLVQWNDTQTEGGNEQCLHEAFERQVKKTPHAAAVIQGEHSLTYAELNEQANRLAHRLRRLGLRPEDRVGVLVKRSPHLLVALFAVLKAGGAYVPLDANHPHQRHLSILKEAGATRILTSLERVTELPPSGIEVLFLNELMPTLTEESADDLSPVTEPANLAYVMFTSGSTGTPKGVSVPHRGLVNYLTWCVRTYGLTVGWTAPVHSSIAFDLTLPGLFVPLLAGGTVNLLPENPPVDALAKTLQEPSGERFVLLTPAHAALLQEQIPTDRLATSARVLVSGGEALRAEVLEPWRRHVPQCRLFNAYGPTETVCACTSYEIPASFPAIGGVPIGRPIANARIYIVDRNLDPIPVGSPGEMYIGGDGLARGYHQRPDLTALRFVPDPFNVEPGGRLYRTGDLGRYRPDGAIDFLGRNDDQLKVRGYRIEPREVESTLERHPGVREAVVVARQDGPGERRLVAYVVPRQPELSLGELKEFLRLRVPEYMVPSVMVLLPELPLKDSGKVDRTRLPAPDEERPDLAQSYLAPRSEVEQSLVAIWCDLLGIERVGVNDSFFEVGGDSLLLLRVYKKMQAVGMHTPITDLFRYPTISGLAQHLSGGALSQGEIDPNRVESQRSTARRQLEIRKRLRSS